MSESKIIHFIYRHELGGEITFDTQEYDIIKETPQKYKVKWLDGKFEENKFISKSEIGNIKIKMQLGNIFMSAKCFPKDVDDIKNKMIIQLESKYSFMSNCAEEMCADFNNWQ